MPPPPPSPHFPRASRDHDHATTLVASPVPSSPSSSCSCSRSRKTFKKLRPDPRKEPSFSPPPPSSLTHSLTRSLTAPHSSLLFLSRKRRTIEPGFLLLHRRPRSGHPTSCLKARRASYPQLRTPLFFASTKRAANVDGTAAFTTARRCCMHPEEWPGPGKKKRASDFLFSPPPPSSFAHQAP